MCVKVLKQLVGVVAAGSKISSDVVEEGSGDRENKPSTSNTDPYLRDQHLAALEGAREEETLLLRNYYKVFYK